MFQLDRCKIGPKILDPNLYLYPHQLLLKHAQWFLIFISFLPYLFIPNIGGIFYFVGGHTEQSSSGHIVIFCFCFEARRFAFVLIPFVRTLSLAVLVGVGDIVSHNISYTYQLLLELCIPFPFCVGLRYVWGGRPRRFLSCVYRTTSRTLQVIFMDAVESIQTSVT